MNRYGLVRAPIQEFSRKKYRSHKFGRVTPDRENGWHTDKRRPVYAPDHSCDQAVFV